MMNDRQHRRSDLQTFDGCPYRYDQVVNHGVDDQSDEAKRGVAFHIIAYLYILLLVKSASSMDHEDAREAFIQGLAIARLPTHLSNDVAILWRRHTSRFELDVDAYLAAEAQQQTRRFRFKPDLVYARQLGSISELELRDFKTYYKILTEMQMGKEFQVRFYLWQAMIVWPGFDRYRFTMVFVRLNVEVSVVFTPDEIAEWGPQIEGIVQGLEQAERAGEWPAIPGAHCTLCRLVCPIADNPKVLPTRVVDRPTFEAAAGRLLVLEREIKALRRVCSGYTSIEGPVVVNGQEFLHSPYSTERYPMRAALDICDDHGFDMSGATVSRSGLGFKKFPNGVGDALARIRITARRSKFRHRKAGEEVPPDAWDALDQEAGERDDDGE